MSQRDQFHQYGYDHYLKAPQKPIAGAQSRKKGGASGFMGRFQKLSVTSLALGLAALLFVGVIIATYPSGDAQDKPIPIIKADLGTQKIAPQNRGGMTIPNKQSTILARAGKPSIKDDTRAIENLLAQSTQKRQEESLLSKEAALAKAFEQSAIETKPEVENLALNNTPPSFAVPDEFRAAESDARTVGTQTPRIEIKTSSNRETTFEIVEEVAPQIVKLSPPTIISQDVLQKIGSKKQPKTTMISSKDQQKIASVITTKKPSFTGKKTSSSQVYAAASSPNTIDYVRSVLNTNNERASAAAPPPNVANIEPAAGAALGAGRVNAGAYFVQLASITDRSRASSEWAKMQGKYNALTQTTFRVQEASLNKGTFYRIQAGPMSKAGAEKLCASLKASQKPGGCFVVN